MRVLSAMLLLYVAACSSSTGGASNNGASLTFPPGIVAFENATAAVQAGIYPGHEKACCFLAPSARLMLDKPAGAIQATFNFYVPKMEPNSDEQIVTVAAAGQSASGSMKGNAGNRIVVTLALPPSYRSKTEVPVTISASKSFVPSKIGLNGDSRNLSVILTKVSYQ
jgi:hypothetical protein